MFINEDFYKRYEIELQISKINSMKVKIGDW